MWSEIEKVQKENRHELVLTGKDFAQRLAVNGGLQPEIFTLSNLNFLDIHDSGLEALPDEISKLQNLQSLVLHSNQLQELNPQVTALSKLKTLDLSQNKIREVPEGIDTLSNLVTLNLSSNVLQVFPTILTTLKLSVLDLSKNNLEQFPEVCDARLINLSELKLSGNEIQEIPWKINKLPALKVLELAENKIKMVPKELAECSKLKVLDLKQNPVSDRRLLKLISQCRTKQILDYVKLNCAYTAPKDSSPKDIVEVNSKEPVEQSVSKYIIKVHYAKEEMKIIIDESVKTVRGHLVACLVENVKFDDGTFKKFIQIQNKLHDTVCENRNKSTIATHDFNKLPPGNLKYSTLPPNTLKIQPLNRSTTLSGAKLFSKLQAEAENLRKEKKRNTYSGIHKYLYLLEGKPLYPCLLNSKSEVISFPPLTNSEISKIDIGTTNLFIEVTSSVTLHCCKVAMDAILKEFVVLLDKELDVVQVKVTDDEGNLKVIYPSKTDLIFEDGSVSVRRD